MALRVLFLQMGCGFWIYFQHDYRPDMKANLALIGESFHSRLRLTLKILISI